MRCLAVLGLVALVGCGPTLAEQQARSEQEYKAGLERAHQLEIEGIKHVHQMVKDCVTALNDLKIGVATIKDTVGLPCDPEHINTTETANVRRDQYVYGLTENWTAYLYFENGKLVAKQI